MTNIYATLSATRRQRRAASSILALAVALNVALAPAAASAGSLVTRELPGGYALPKGFVAPAAGADDYGFVVIRWPAHFDDGAIAILRDRFDAVNRTLMYGQKPADIEAQNVGFAQISTKSTYYAAELFEILANYMPADRILLDPLTISATADGKLVSTSTKTIDVPVAMVVDFTADPALSLLQGEGTRGAFVLPVISAATAPDASPQTMGALMRTTSTPYPLVDPTGSGSSRDGTAFDGLQAEFLESASQNFDAALPGAVPLAPKPIPTPGMVLQVPLFSQPLDDKLLKASADPAFKFDITKPHDPAVEAVAVQIARTFTVVDRSKAYHEAFLRYAAMFDDGLAHRMRAGNLKPADADKIKALQAFALAEVKFLNSHDAAMADYILNSREFGQSFRRIRGAEDEAVRKFHNQQTSQAFWSFVGAVVLVGAAASSAYVGAATTDPGLAAQAASNMTVATNLMASSMSTDQANHDTMVADVLNNFTASTAGAVARSDQFSVALPGRVSDLRAANLDELREGMKKLWDESFGLE